MRDNYEACIVGNKCILVPYRPEHVATYHEWMKNPFLLESTGSEPLSMDEEVEMQQSWRDDPEKCTFIVLAKAECSTDYATNDKFVENNLSPMVGDVNLFLSIDEHDEDEASDKSEKQKRTQAELDIMIAEEKFRGQGMGREASCLMMMYGAESLGIKRFYCKIKEENTASRTLFASLGFVQCNYAECFQEVELELKAETSQEMADTISKQLVRQNCDTIKMHKVPWDRTRGANTP